ncbi:MAG: acetoin dehydrogenase [Rhodospirillales bacterium 20-60-12]|nr:MAG: acetoin dehydrogenase [Rhodospirillales bacterium 20-60-12]HQT67017.1 SDR family NAD(P)-dependent oxidoreductase [Acetobacteraceae bacterium]
MKLEGMTAVLTGAGSGMGAELAVLLAARGTNLALVDRNEAGLDATAARVRSNRIRVSTHVLDIADGEGVAALPAAVQAIHGKSDILINNAGVALAGRFDQMSHEDFKWLMDINFWGAVRLTEAFLPELRTRRAGHIVFLSSVFGIVAPPGQTAYVASKFAIRGFAESLRHELAESRIGVTVVHPGGVATAIARSAKASAGMDQATATAAGKSFEKMLKTPAHVAAAKILHGIETDAPRVLIGNDARMIDIIQRLMPVKYWRLMKRQASSAKSLTTIPTLPPTD